MDTLLEKLNGIDRKDKSIEYINLLMDFQKSSGILKSRFVNYIAHGINQKLISVDKLFFNAVIFCETIEECDIIGLCIRFGADLNKFYDGKNIMWYVIEKFQKTERELFVFITCMFLISGLTYNDYMFKDDSMFLHSYFKQRGLEMFFPHNIIMENQKKMNLYLDNELNGEQFHYTIKEIVENLCINLIRKQVTKRSMVNFEDTLIKSIINSGNINMFMSAFESSYMVSYFSMERLRIAILNTNNHIIRNQLIEILYYLDDKNILLDGQQYESISHYIEGIKCVIRDDRDVKMTLRKSRKQITPSRIFTIFGFDPSYVKFLNEEETENIMYKIIKYKIKEIGIESVLDML